MDMARAKFTKTERENWVRRYDESGMAPAAFCRQHGLIASTLSNWLRERKQVGVSAEAGAGSPIEFVRVARRGEGSSELAILAGGARIVVRRGFDPKLLSEVVSALSGEERES